MDIRKFFSPVNKTSQNKDKGVSKEKKRKLKRIDSDDEDSILSKCKKVQSNAFDSDDDLFIITPKSDKTAGSKAENSSPLNKKTKSAPIPKCETKPTLKPALAKEFFGSSPITQSFVKPEKTKKTSEAHNDDDFAKTLLQLDKFHNPKKAKIEDKLETSKEDSSKKEIQIKLNNDKKSQPNENSPPKKKTNDKMGLASKLSSKAKESGNKCLEHGSKPLSDKSRLTNSQKSPAKVPKVQKYSGSDSFKSLTKLTKSSSLKKSSKQSYDVEFVKHEKDTKKIEENKEAIPVTPEADEKRKQHSLAYKKFLQRSGPINPGGKPLPEGKSNCLYGLTFVLTGVLDTIDREETTELIKKYGGRVTTSISQKTSYVVVGNEPGESKLKKAEQLKTKQVDEDGLFDLITNNSSKEDDSLSSKAETPKSSGRDSGKSKLSKFEHNPNLKRKLVQEEATDHLLSPPKKNAVSKNTSFDSSCSSPSKKSISSSWESSQQSCTQPISSPIILSRTSPSIMWVDKYKPASLKNIIGQQGDQSNARKLYRWLSSWASNQSGNKKLVKPSPWSKDNSGAYFKAALLSGPPGVGKTTTTYLTTKELGFDAVEFNASDTRSKRALCEEVSELLSNTSLVGFATGNADRSMSRNHILIMDEVDGMAGNEDRGGVQELIGLIKSSKVPIICMCNDRNHPKIRSLANYCFDLRFQKPKVEQIRGAMMSVCFKEGIKIKPEALDQIIIGSNQDVRQVLHHLSLWSASEKNLNVDQMKKDSQMAKKDFKLGPWDVVNKVFSESSHKGMSIHDKTSLFFHDYSIGPLFVQENYLKVVPHAANGNKKLTLKQVAKTAAVLADSDLIDKAIRQNSAWSLLPTQALFASVLPGEYMTGHFSSQVEFPKWLGNNSRKNKFDRLAQDLHTHLRLRISGSKQDVISDYSLRICDAVVNPLVKHGPDGVKASVLAMTTHDLVREDLESLIELTTWPGMRDKLTGVDSKVKAAFTRALNKDSHMSPFSTSSVISKKKIKSSNDQFDIEDDDDGDEEDNEDDDITKDSMIKAGKKTAASKDNKASTSSVSKSKGGKSKNKK